MRIIVGITGASGAILAKRFLNILKNLKTETDLIITDEGKAVIRDEIGNDALKGFENLATKIFNVHDFSAEIASGSICYGKNKRDAMVIIPCSMNTAAKLAGGISDNLILRTCDVMLKENKKVIVVPRECPFNYNHLENLSKLKKMNVVIIPPVLTFYHKPKTIEDMIDFTMGKILDNLDIEHNLIKRWKN